MGRLSKRAVEAAEIRASEYVLWDGDIPGFGVRIMPSGRRTYLVQYRVGTRSRKLALGPHGVLTSEQARARAMQTLGDVKGGADLAEVRKERRESITVSELADRCCGFRTPRPALRSCISDARRSIPSPPSNASRSTARDRGHPARQAALRSPALLAAPACTCRA